MLYRSIAVLVLAAGQVAGQPARDLLPQVERAIPRISAEEASEALQTEATVPSGRFSFEDAGKAMATACRTPVSATHAAQCWSYRGLWHQLQGQFTEAESLYVRAISSFEEAPVANQRLLATTLHNLGATYRELRRLQAAKQVLWRALALRKDAYGEDHPLTASTLGQLGTVHLAAGELTKAEELLQTAVSTHERFLPATDPDRVTTVHNLAQLRIAQNRSMPAIELLRGLITPSVGAADPPSLVHAAPYQTLAALYRQLGEYARALPLLRMAQRLYEDSFGSEDLTSALVRVEFGLLSAAEGKNQLAKTQLRDARVRLVRILGGQHPQVASVENNLAVVCLHIGNVDEAAVLLEQAIHTVRSVEDGPERELGVYLTNMAEVRRRQGKLQESEAHLREALGLLEKTLTPDSPEVLGALEQYAAVLNARRSPGVQNVMKRIRAIRSHLKGSHAR